MCPPGFVRDSVELTGHCVMHIALLCVVCASQKDYVYDGALTNTAMLKT